MADRHDALSFIWCGAVLLLTPSAAASVPADLEARVATLVEEAREQAGIPALAVAVVANGKVVAELASGFADREAATPATCSAKRPRPRPVSARPRSTG